MGWAWIRITGWLLAACLMAAVPRPVSAEAAGTLVGMPVPVCIAAAQPGDDWRTMLRDHRHFDCRVDQARLPSGDYWARSAMLPPDTGVTHRANVRTASLWQTRVTLYAAYADGRVVIVPTDGRAVSQRIQLGAIVQWRLPERGVPIVRLMWHVEGAANIRGILRSATIASSRESDRANLLMGAIYAAFCGLCVALLVHNLALWAALRYRFQLVYCAMVAALLAYAVSSSGVLAWLVPEIANNDRIRINYVTLALAAVAALAFARSFFEARVFAGRLRGASNVIMAALLGSAMLFVIGADRAPRALDRVCAWSFVLLLGIVAPLLWRAWRMRSNYLWLFALAWGAPIALATVRVASNFAWIGSSLWLDNSTILSMALEALLSSLAIAYRIRLLSVERDEAREQEIAARLLADTDPLTGLMNRRAFLRGAIGRTGEQTLVLADIDHFKAVNDTLGHDGGDEVLRVIARALRFAVPDDALVARIGGEEFAILAPVSSDLSPTHILDEVRAERMPFDVRVTVSLGRCAGPLASEADWKALYGRADRALFEAKAAGRDRARDAERLAVAA